MFVKDLHIVRTSQKEQRRKMTQRIEAFDSDTDQIEKHREQSKVPVHRAQQYIKDQHQGDRTHIDRQVAGESDSPHPLGSHNVLSSSCRISRHNKTGPHNAFSEAAGYYDDQIQHSADSSVGLWRYLSGTSCHARNPTQAIVPLPACLTTPREGVRG